MMLKQRLLDWWGRSYHAQRSNVIEAALSRAGGRGMSSEELFEKTEFSHGHIRVAIRKLKREGRVKEMDGRCYWISKPTSARDPEGSL